MKKQTKKTNNQKTAKHSKSGLTAFIANNFKYILATIAIIIAIIAVFFGESKLILSDTKSANVNYNILYYRNVQTEERFLTLADAVANAETLQNSGVYATNTIQVINNRTETSAVTIPAGTDIVLDLNGKTVTYNIDAQSEDTSAIVNNGTLRITDSTQAVNEYNYTMKDGTKPHIGGTLTSNKVALTNNGTGNIDGTAHVQGTGSDTYTIENDGDFTIEGGTVTSTVYNIIYNGRNNEEDANITINGGTIISARTGISNRGNLSQENKPAIKIFGGKIETQRTAIGNLDASTGLIYISGGDITGGLLNESNPTIYNGGNGKVLIDEDVLGGTIITDFSSAEAIQNANVVNATGITEIRGGTIIAKYGHAIYNARSGTIIIGTDEVAAGEITSVSTTVPSITGKIYGVSSTSTFKFYDGIIKGGPGTQQISGKAIDGTVSDKPTGYDIVNGTATYNGTEYKFATLAPTSANYLLHDGTNVVNTYTTLKEAFDAATDSSKQYRVNVLKDVTDASSATPTVASGKNVTLDLNGKTITTTGILKNSGTLTITGNGTITNSSTDVINVTSSGKLSITGGTIRSSSTTNNVSAIYAGNTSTLNISGGTIEKTGTGDAACVVFNSTGTATITGGTIKVGETSGSYWAFFNQSSGSVTITNAEIIHDGTATAWNAAAVVNNTGTLEIGNGASISSKNNNAVLNYGTGTTTVSSGTITGNKRGVYNYSTGTVTIGKPDGTVVTNSPKIIATNSTGEGIRAYSGTLNFYDGIIYAPTVEKTIDGTVTDKEPNYDIVNGSANYGGQEYKFATLAPTSANYMLHDGTNVVNTYTTLKEAFDVATDSSKEYRVNVLKDVTDASSATPTVASGKNVVLDLNSHSITTAQQILNNGNATLEITDTTVTNNATAGKIESSTRVITNDGTFIASGKAELKSTASGSSAIVNNGAFTLNGATISSTNYKAIYNGNTNVANAKVTILDGTVTAKNIAIDNYGTSNTEANSAQNIEESLAVIINGGTITTSSSLGATVKNNSSGTIKIGGTAVISHTASKDAVMNNNANGTVIMNGGTLNVAGVSESGISGSGNIRMTGGTINSAGNGLYSYGTKTITMTGGTINAARYGIYNYSTGKIIAGTSSGGVNTTSPVVIGGTEGIHVGSGTLEFYDGIIKAPTEAKTISGTVTETPPHYRVVYGEDTSAGLKTAYLSNQYNVQFLAENLLDGYTLENSSVSYNTDTFSGPTNGVYSGTLTKSASYWRINASKFTAGKTYILRYKIQKTAGTLKNIAGASVTATQQSFTVDGEASSIKYNISISTPASNIADDTNEHTIEFKFLYNGNQTDNNIYIQPNRGYTDSVTVNLYDVELYEVVDERTKTYGTTLGTLPTPTRAGYSLTGWYTNDNLITTDKSDWEQGGINDADGTTSTNTSVAPRRLRLKDYQAVSSNATYTLTTDSSGDIKIRYVYLYDGSKNFIAHDSGNVGNAGGRNTVTFTTPSNCSYIRVALQKTNADSDTITVDELPTAQLCLTGAVTDATTMPGNDITCYAEWDTISTTITIRKNTGAWSDSGMKIDLSTNNSSNTATFTQTVSSGSEAVFENLVSGTTYYIYAGKHSSAKTTMVNTGLTIVAGESKTVDYYTISRSQGTGTTLTTRFDSSSGSSLSSGTNVLKGVTIYAKATINLGYHGTVTLKHGSTSMTASGGTFTVSTNETITSGGATRNSYTIVFNKNASDASGTMSNLAMTFGIEKNLTANAFTRSGYVFKEWNTLSNGSGTSYSDGQSVNNLTTTNNGTVNLYAQWEKVQLQIGDSVDYSTTLNGVTLDDWKVFYKDGNYTYIILGDYLPNAAVSNTVRTTHNLANGDGIYSIKSIRNRGDLLDAMTTKSNWDSLLSGTLNGTTQVNQTRTANVWAMGAPTLDLWVNSWNAKYPSDRLYTKYENPISGKTFDGWYIGNTEEPTTKSIDLSSKTGYGNTLYYPHQATEQSCDGYWLASPSADGASSVMRVSYRGFVGYHYYSIAWYRLPPRSLSTI